MKAIVRDNYGLPGVLRTEEIDCPTPDRDEVLVRIRASSLNRADRYTMQGIPLPIRLVMGLFKPKKRGMGMDFAGDVEAVGKGVTQVHPGAAVYGQVDFGETWAEYACIPVSMMAPKPANLTYEQAASVPLAAITALQGLRDHGELKSGQSVLINGASGAVGSFAVQIAKALGAVVTGVCSQRNLELARSLGADHMVAYESEDFCALDCQFDVMFDIVGNRPLSVCRRVLKAKAIYLPVGGPVEGLMGPMTHLLTVMFQAPFVSQRVVMFNAKPNRDDLLVLTEMIESGKVVPVIDRQFKLDEIAEAMRYLMEGRPTAKVVISVP
jgi:NADPH:quinone reductase-like Zn-dependent oxidoreductase